MAPRTVCIVGAGASGMSAAYALSRHPDAYQVTVFDKEAVPGGMATSVDIDASKYGASYINDGVQGCSPAFANTIKMFRMLGFECTGVGMQISFGQGDDFWSNVFPSTLVRHFAADIKKFGRVLRIIKALEPLFAFIPVHTMLRLFGFSRDFGEKMVYPLVALFFGTGNQTPYIACAILERVFMDSSMKLFEYNEQSLLASIPTMYGFPKLRDVYETWKTECEMNGNVTFKLGSDVTRIVSRSKKNGVQVQYKPLNGPGDAPEPATETFDELILACDADSALKLLGKQATWMERRVLGSVKYLYDVTITHTDKAYMDAHYETTYDPSFNAASAGKADDEAFEFARTSFRPLYYTHQYDTDRSKIEMSFDLTHYQPQFRHGEAARALAPEGRTRTARDVGDTVAAEEGSSSSASNDAPSPPHVYQTIFLDRDGSQDLWTRSRIRAETQVYEKWWKQQSHRWQHYARVVPWMMFINGKNNTLFAGAWTVLNMHELAVTAGFSAAYRLGADFPFKGDAECERLFKLYLALSHGTRVRKEDRSGFFA